MRCASPVILAPEEKSELEKWSRGRSTPHRMVLRASIVLHAAEGLENSEIALKLNTRPNTVGLWRKRFALLRLDGIRMDAPRAGRKQSLPPELMKRIVEATLHEKPAGETHWSTRSLARHLGVSHMTVQRVWNEHGLQPHRTRSFKLSRDRHFEEKLIDVVGLYMNPPEKAVVFSVDEKPQVQALERTQTVIPMAEHWPEGRPHDYRRNGKVDLFAALNILDGKVIHEYHERHRHQEFLAFLRRLDSEVAGAMDIHVILDNLSAHGTDEVGRWLSRHRRFHFHFIPTGSSWVNMVESWFSQLEKKALHRGSFKNVHELKKAIEAFVHATNGRAEPWTWTKDASRILEKVAKIRHRMGLAE